MQASDTMQAFALGFPHGETTAPVVTARGDFDVAAHMVAVARRHGIPVVERPEICSLLSDVEVGCSIPETLFRAAAALLVELGVLGEDTAKSL
jgi:type III secretion system FlhB-like substrate exporter